MSKEFKIFDQKYKHLMGTALKAVEFALGYTVDGGKLKLADRWAPSSKTMFTEDYSHDQIRWAVYEAPDAEEWQKFRVALKGLNTYEKLFCLDWYFWFASNKLYTDPTRDKIRVNNYLGALKRSGHLDSELRVIKA